MEKNYRKIEFGIGGRIDDAIDQLSKYKELGELVYGEFNGRKLYSDIDDLDSAYKKITGLTKSQFDRKMKEEDDKYEQEKRRHKNSIPQLTEYWIEYGNTILDEKYHETWAECVPIRLDDLYQGMELKCCLDIITKLNNNGSLDEAKSIIESQGHSGMSFGLVCSMVKSFCDRGTEFVSYVRNK